MTAEPVFSLTKRNSKAVHIERRYAESWCGTLIRLRTVAPTPPMYLCPRCKAAHARHHGLPNIARRTKP